MKTKVITSAALALILSNTAIADSHKPTMSESVVVKQQLEVIQINHEERWVMLKDRSGFTSKVDVGNSVQNFAQVAVGDVVNVNFAETIQIEAYGADAINAGEEVEAIFARAEKGQKPGAIGAAAKTVVVTITNIDLEHTLVTLEDKQGNSRTFRPRLPSNLKKVKVGDKVAISFAKAMAIDVEAGDK